MTAWICYLDGLASLGVNRMGVSCSYGAVALFNGLYELKPSRSQKCAKEDTSIKLA